MSLGTVTAVWRYPVKSMMGEEVHSSPIGERGLRGDRAYALIDRETNKVASAKHAKGWPGLFECRAAYVEPPDAEGELPPVRIGLPDGSHVVTGEDDVDAALSALIGRPVTLASSAPKDAKLDEYWPDMDGLTEDVNRDTVTEEQVGIIAPPGTFFDAAPVHLLTTATLDRLREVRPQTRFEARRFRPNLVVTLDNGEAGFAENDWVGHWLRVGEEVSLPVMVPVPRCVMTTHAQGDLPRDPGVLRAPAEHNLIPVPTLGDRACVGVYAGVSVGGSVRRGDAVALADR